VKQPWKWALVVKISSTSVCASNAIFVPLSGDKNKTIPILSVYAKNADVFDEMLTIFLCLNDLWRGILMSWKTGLRSIGIDWDCLKSWRNIDRKRKLLIQIQRMINIWFVESVGSLRWTSSRWTGWSSKQTNRSSDFVVRLTRVQGSSWSLSHWINTKTFIVLLEIYAGLALYWLKLRSLWTTTGFIATNANWKQLKI
jgi:hypothetical protein